MSAELLAAALARLGTNGRVEAHGRLAVLVVRDAGALSDEPLRRTLLRLASDHGFSHLAVELDERVDTAAVHRAQSSA